jgi:hypothetical protein
VFLPKLILPGAQNSMVYQSEVCKEEIDIEDVVISNLKKNGKFHVERVWGSTIHHIDDLKMEPENVASGVYTKYR